MVSVFFFSTVRFEQGKHKVLKTVRWTVLVPACVPWSAKATRANLAVSAKDNRNLKIAVVFFM